jgi:hypothetical protein
MDVLVQLDILGVIFLIDVFVYDCLTWNDGCNHCEVRDGKLSLCTEMYCFTMGTPQCEVFAPDIMPLPAIDPMPPVVNPFLGDGH